MSFGLYRGALMKRSKIIVVTPDRTTAYSLTNLLLMLGHCAFAAFSGHGALILAQHFKPQCIVAGFLLADMNWVAFASAVHEQLPSCKLLFISTDSRTAELVGKARQRGFKAQLLPKAAPHTELLRVIAALLRPPEHAAAAAV